MNLPIARRIAAINHGVVFRWCRSVARVPDPIMAFNTDFGFCHRAHFPLGCYPNLSAIGSGEFLPEGQERLEQIALLLYTLERLFPVKVEGSFALQCRFYFLPCDWC